MCFLWTKPRWLTADPLFYPAVMDNIRLACQPFSLTSGLKLDITFKDVTPAHTKLKNRICPDVESSSSARVGFIKHLKG